MAIVPITLNLSEKGVERLQEVADWLEAGAPHIARHGLQIDGFDMDVGITDPTNSCGAVCCIAGALVQFNRPFQGVTFTGAKEVAWAVVAATAAELLGLPLTDDNKARLNALFRPNRENAWITPAIAARVLRHLIATGEVVWDRYEPAHIPDFEEED